ncbi:hypothetical protein PVAP13_7NG085300 [Panicum virgatum]|uniref:Uncharacterized protein n=1 Tax=Panicum virgatum TaxID=38727 RepID=A0A8T0PQQ5_PANVG|nr:hypothetical protein PVAP13_7NG085300 [Panicum virgatum]
MHGRLKSFSVETSQGIWYIHVSSVTGAGRPPADAARQPQPSARPQPQVPCDANMVKIKNMPPTRSVHQSHAGPSTGRDLHESDDDDDDDAFMEPPPWRHVLKKQCTNANVAANATAKTTKTLVKYAHAPTVRCAPLTFNKFVDNLTLNQRIKIIEMGFGGLLGISAERIGSRELLKFLFDRLDPNSMVIELGKNRGIHVTPFAMKQVLGIPDSDEDLPLQTNNHASKALSKLKIMLGLEECQDLHASHLQKILKDDLELCSNLIDDETAIRFFFIIASNKLLFPSTDNNIRCKDIYLTRDLSRLSDMNGCKAVVDDLRHAAHAYHIDKTKKGTPSLPGCAILLIIEHMNTPRAKHFDQNVIQKITSADRTKDQQGKATFGLLPLKSSNNTCYYTTHHPFSNVPANNEPLAASYFPSIIAELGGFVDQIDSRTRQSQARAALAKFDAKSKKASSYMNTGQLMLQNAHQKAIRNLRAILQDKAHGNIGQDHHHQPNTSDTAQADDVSMHGSRNGHNMGSEHVFDKEVPSETRENDLHSSGHPNQDRPLQFAQNGAREPDLPNHATLHQTHDETFPQTDNVHCDKDMEGEPSLVSSQVHVHTGLTSDHVLPPDVADGNTTAALPITTQAGDVYMHDTHTGHNMGFELEFDMPIQLETRANELHSGDHTNQDINHATPMQLEQHMALESGIPIPIAQHNSHDDSFPRSDVIHLT